MHIEPITDQTIWDAFQEQLQPPTFLHTGNWARFNQELGRKTFQLGLWDANKNLISVALLIKTIARRGTFLLCPHGPQGLNLDREQLKIWTAYFKALARLEKCSFVRVCPILEETPDWRNALETLGYNPAPVHLVHPELTLVVDLQKSETELLQSFKKDTRYDIRKALDLVKEKKLEITHPTEISDEMYQLYFHTTKRGGFTGFTAKYLNQEYQTFREQGQSQALAIWYEGKLLSWGMFIFTHHRAFYHHGANQIEKGVPASSLCQWEALKLAQQQGCISYDFWGIAPEKEPGHHLTRVSKFKRGFGGSELQFLHVHDLPITGFYWVNWLIESIRAVRKRHS